jgi:DNA gyrase subunit A
VNVLPLRQDEMVKAVIDTRNYGEGKYLLFATKGGIVKKTEFKAYDTVLKADGIKALKVREGDELIGVKLTDGDDAVLMVSRNGSAVRFSEQDVRPMGRDTAGVAGMRLRSGDEVIAVEIARDEQDLLVVTENGFGKRTRVAEYPTKGRGTMGVLTIRYTESRGRLAGAMIVKDGYEVMLISHDGTVIRTRAEGISRMGRATQGVRVMNLREGDHVSSIARVTEPQPAATPNGDTPDPDGVAPEEPLDEADLAPQSEGDGEASAEPEAPSDS